MWRDPSARGRQAGKRRPSFPFTAIVLPCLGCWVMLEASFPPPRLHLPRTSRLAPSTLSSVSHDV
jgi:hypothetical protein